MVPLAAHEHPPVGELLHRADGQPAAPVEEPPLAVGQPRPVVLAVVQHAGVEHQVLGAGDQHERVELEVAPSRASPARPLEAAPAPARPQPLTAEHVATRGLVGDVDRGVGGGVGHPCIVRAEHAGRWQVRGFVIASRIRAVSRACGDVWFRQGLVTGEREPRMPLGLVNQVAKRSTWQPPVDSRSRCLGSRVSVEAASASRVVEASLSGAAIRISVT